MFILAACDDFIYHPTDENRNIVNAFSTEALSGGYTLENGCLTGTNLQLAIENTIELYAEKIGV